MTEYQSIKPDVLALLEAHLPEIREQFGIETLGIFGSVSRGEDTPDSDVDILYRFQKGKGSMRTIVPLMNYLKALFNREVDLISFDYISPLIENSVTTDAIVIEAQV
jgi:Predicted nucleotidyltransferases